MQSKNDCWGQKSSMQNTASFLQKQNKILILFVCVTIEKQVESHLSDASGYHGAKKGGWNKKFLWYYLSIFQSFLAWFGIIFVFFPDF